MWRNDDEEDFAPPLTPLIDIVFLLIIFFLVATTFLDDEKDLAISLPESTEGFARQVSTRPATINVRADGSLLWGDQRVTDEELEARLRGWGRKYPGIGIILRGDRATAHQQIVRVLTLCRQTGVNRVSIAVAAEK